MLKMCQNRTIHFNKLQTCQADEPENWSDLKRNFNVSYARDL